ncbi:MAG: hypothetical protein ABFD89_00960 [Bryobacteraceae bacterium]
MTEQQKIEVSTMTDQERIADLQRQLSDSQARECGLREALTFVEEKCSLYGPADAARERIRTAINEASPCPHQQEAERLAAIIDDLHRNGTIGLIAKPMCVKILSARDARVRVETLRAAAEHLRLVSGIIGPLWDAGWIAHNDALLELAGKAERGEWPEGK